MGTRELRFTHRPAELAIAGAGLVTVAICGSVAISGDVGSIERRIFEAINGLPDALTSPMTTVQYIGTLAIGPIVALVALIMRRYRLALAALLVTVGKLAAERVVWELVQRQRPGVTEPDAIVRGDTALRGLSFVSGHMILVTGLAWVVAPYLRGSWRIAPWLVVIVVGFARIYLGAHNPLDVVGGIALGLAVGALANLIVGTPEPIATA